MIVGEVLAFDASAEGAELTLGIYPDEMDTIPANVTGSIVPKTLFGEKYVSLEIPESGPEGQLDVDAVIDRTEVSIEVEKVLSDLYPLLRTVQPAEINKTLNAMATALEGRGERLGENLETVDSYLKRVNPQIPDIVEDLRLTAQVSDLYADVMPEIASILRNTITTTQTLEGRDAKVRALYTDVAAFSDTSRDFLAENGDNLIRLGEVSAAQLRVFAKYAPEYPCLTGGIVNAGELQAEAFRGFTLHIVLEHAPQSSRAGTGPATAPRFGETRGPELPEAAQPAVVTVQPGAAPAEHGRRRRRADRQGHQPGRPRLLRPAASASPAAAPESAMLNSLLGPTLGVTARDVPDLGALLVAPMARGAEVSLR